MRFWKTILKRSALALVTAALAFSWTRTGQTQSPCLVERGQDPLDVLNSGVRHNVWIVLDSSGSMAEDMNGGTTTPSKMTVAKQTLTEVIDEFVDSSGKPLVNWGFVRFGANAAPSTATACSYQFLKPSTSAPAAAGNGCIGLNLNGLINPPPCSAPSNTTAVKNAINASPTSGNTPNGVAVDQISERIVANGFVTGLLPNQKNFVILVSDGDDTCECNSTTQDIAGTMVDGVWTPTRTPLPQHRLGLSPRKIPFRGCSAVARRTSTTRSMWEPMRRTSKPRTPEPKGVFSTSGSNPIGDRSRYRCEGRRVRDRSRSRRHQPVAIQSHGMGSLGSVLWKPERVPRSDGQQQGSVEERPSRRLRQDRRSAVDGDSGSAHGRDGARTGSPAHQLVHCARRAHRGRRPLLAGPG